MSRVRSSPSGPKAFEIAAEGTLTVPPGPPMTVGPFKRGDPNETYSTSLWTDEPEIIVGGGVLFFPSFGGPFMFVGINVLDADTFEVKAFNADTSPHTVMFKVLGTF